MSRLKFYYETHLKSLYISKFFFKSRFFLNKTSLKSLLIKLKFYKKDISSLDLKWLFFFFITGQWPIIKIKYESLRGKKIIKLDNFQTILRKNAKFVFLDKLILLNLVNLENWIKTQKKFELLNYYNKNIYQNIFILNELSIFWEFEFLLRSRLKVIKKETEESFLLINFFFNSEDQNKNLTILNSLEFPAKKK